MVVVIQRVRRSKVEVEGKKVGEIGKGITCFLGIENQDTEEEAIWLADKVVNLRIFEDESKKMNRSLIDVGGEMLVVSQFTLLANCIKGRRPSFIRAAEPSMAEKLYNFFINYIREKYNLNVETGIFGAMMMVYIENDGPVTFIINTKDKFTAG